MRKWDMFLIPETSLLFFFSIIKQPDPVIIADAGPVMTHDETGSFSFFHTVVIAYKLILQPVTCPGIEVLNTLCKNEDNNIEKGT